MHHRRASDNSSNCLPANDRKKNIVRWEKRIQLIPRLSCRICSLFSDRCLDVTACASFSCWSYQEKKKKANCNTSLMYLHWNVDWCDKSRLLEQHLPSTQISWSETLQRLIYQGETKWFTKYGQIRSDIYCTNM